MTEKQQSLHISEKTHHEFVSQKQYLAMEQFGLVQAGIAHCRESFTIARKGYDKFLLLYTVKGEGELFAEGKRWLLESGSLIVIPANVDYQFNIYQEEWQIAWVFLSPDCELSSRFGDQVEYQLSNLAEPMYAVILLLLRSRRLKTEVSTALCTSAIEQAKLLIGQGTDNYLSEKRLRLDRVFDHVQCHLHKEWNIEQLAALYPCSMPHFHRLCLAYLGHSPKQHLTRMRMEYAGRLLTTTSWPVQQIGEIVGYPIPANFTSRFKIWSGMTPKGYRAIHGIELRLNMK